MTYGELKQRMTDFGFEEATYTSDPMALSEFISSINQARQTISQNIPYKATKAHKIKSSYEYALLKESRKLIY